METNQLLALLFIGTGVMDLGIAWFAGARMAPAARRALNLFGSVFLVLGFAIFLGHIRLV